MRARLFFRVMNHGRKIYFRERSIFIAELCDAATIPLSLKNHDIMKKHYIERAFGKPKRRGMDLKDPNTIRILDAAFRAAAPGMRGLK